MWYGAVIPQGELGIGSNRSCRRWTVMVGVFEVATCKDVLNAVGALMVAVRRYWKGRERCVGCSAHGKCGGVWNVSQNVLVQPREGRRTMKTTEKFGENPPSMGKCNHVFEAVKQVVLFHVKVSCTTSEIVLVHASPESPVQKRQQTVIMNHGNMR
ncbi:hypothetical protein J1614_011458 [Plenodomus biglobosus]|nr:hypothetical protein J1614_011458 [Plenodomus biglobosus]